MKTGGKRNSDTRTTLTWKTESGKTSKGTKNVFNSIELKEEILDFQRARL